MDAAVGKLEFGSGIDAVSLVFVQCCVPCTNANAVLIVGGGTFPSLFNVTTLVIHSPSWQNNYIITRLDMRKIHSTNILLVDKIYSPNA